MWTLHCSPVKHRVVEDIRKKLLLVTNNVLSVKDFKHIHETYGYSCPPGRILKVFLFIAFTTLQSGVALPSWPRLGCSPLERPRLERPNVLVYPELGEFPEHISFIVKTSEALGKPGRVGHHSQGRSKNLYLLWHWHSCWEEETSWILLME